MNEKTLTVGSTILLPSTHHNPDKHHLCIVLNDPRKSDGGQVLYAPIITARYKFDATCILEVGDHRFIKHKSCVHYATMSQRSESHLLKIGKVYDPLPGDVLERVLEGVVKSPHSAPWAKKLIQKK